MKIFSIALALALLALTWVHTFLWRPAGADFNGIFGAVVFSAVILLVLGVFQLWLAHPDEGV